MVKSVESSQQISSEIQLNVATVTLVVPKIDPPPEELIQVLVLCPPEAEKQLLAGSEFSAYCFHCLEYPALQTTPPKLAGSAELVTFCRDAIAYAKFHQIETVYYSFDIANLVAAVLCQSLNLVGPRLESVLQCFHKFYAREIDSSPPGYCLVHLENDEEIIVDQQAIESLRFPVFVKPVCSSYGMFCDRVERPEQLTSICKSLAKAYQPWWQVYRTLFQEFCDTTKYPLAIGDRVPLLVEEMISGQPVTCDGFVYRGQVHCLGLVDTVETEDGAVDCYAFPSQVTQAQHAVIYDRVAQFVRESKLDNSFFSAEFWLQDNSHPILIEINARMSATFGFLYQQRLNFNLYKAALTLARGHCPELPKSTLEEQTEPVSCRLYLSTRKNGLASALFDFNLARETLENSSSLVLNCQLDESIESPSYHPTPLAELNLVGANRAALQYYGDHLRKALLLERRESPYRANVVSDCQFQGGEGLCYDADRHRLFCLDYGESQLIQLCLTTRKIQRFPLPGTFYGVAVSLRETVVLSGELGLMEFDLNTRKLVPILQEYRGKPFVCNDVIVDATGRIWFNTIDEDATRIKGMGGLFACDRATVSPEHPHGRVWEICTDLGYANGMGLSPDGRSLYVVDSVARAVRVFEIDQSDPERPIRDRYQWTVADKSEGVPDGLAVDAAGRLWLSFWFGGKVVCFDPRSQTRVREICLPAMNVASVAVVDTKDSSGKLFACSSAVPWEGGKILAPWYADDLPRDRRGYLFEIDL